MPTQLPDEHRLRAPGSMELDPSGEGVAIEETVRLIASNKVEGTPVYNELGDELGAIHNFMVDKYTGQVAYAVMVSGAFLGFGGSHHPLPWRALNYEPTVGGYVLKGDDQQLTNAPRYSESEDPFAEPGFGEKVDAHYP